MTGASSVSIHRTLRCPGCRRTFLVAQAAAARRCAACGTVVEGAGGGRWLYPLPPGELAAGGRVNTAATTDAYTPAPTDTFDMTFSTCDAPTEVVVAPAAPPSVDRYQLRGELGRGGMGVVYRAWDPELERLVALKVLTGGRFASGAATARFIGEARAAASLSHPGIVSVNDLGQVDGQPYFTMDLVRGPSLEAVLKELGPLRVAEAARVAEGVARAVQHAHDARVAHRDLKPGNVLLTCDGEPRVTDFGLAKPLDQERHLTATAAVLGTPAFMAPEIAAATGEVDWLLADVYGLGGILYMALTGAPPASGATLAQTLDAAATGRRKAVRSVRPEVPAALAAIADRALHLEPGRRYPSAGALAEDLARFLRGEAVLARPESARERLGRWARRHRTLLRLTGAAAAAVLAAVLVPQGLEWRARRAAEQAADEAWAAVSERIHAARAAGDDDAAEALYDEFIEAPQHQGTAAVARAWLARGDEYGGELPSWMGQPDTTLVGHWAQAILAAPEDSYRVQALLRIARWQAEHGRFALMYPLIETAAGMDDGRFGDALLEARLLQAVHTLQLEEAVPLWDQARARGLPLADQLADPRWLLEGVQGGRVLFTYDGERPWAYLNETLDGRPVVSVRQGDEFPARLDASSDFAPLPEDTPLVEGFSVVDIYDPSGALLEEGATWYGLRPADLDGDGVDERYSLRWREGMLQVRGDRGVFYKPGQAPISRDCARLATGDVDGDGSDELVVGCTEWSSYDIRVITGDGEGGLKLRARAQRSAPMAVLLVPDPWSPGTQLVVSGETDIFANTAVYGEEDPVGPPSGLVVYRLVGDALEEVFHYPSHFKGTPGVVAADLDGDGHQELMMISGSTEQLETMVLRPGAAPYTYALAPMPGARVLGAGELDGDDAGELVMLADAGGERQLWALGAGDLRLPPLPPAPPRRPQPLPAGLAGTPWEGTWDALQALQLAGLLPEAAQAMEGMAAISSEAVSAEVEAAAAALWEEEGRLIRAAEAWERAAAARGAQGEEAWARAVSAWLAAADPARALAVWRRWQASGSPGPEAALASTLEAWAAARERSVDLSRQPLHPSLRIEEPLAVTADGGSLRLEQLSAGSTLASLPLRWAGGAVSLEARLTFDHLEWGGSGGLGLLPMGEGADAWFSVFGGGGVNRMDAHCRIAGDTERLETPPVSPGPPTTLTFELRMSWTPEDPRWRCSVALADSGRVLHRTAAEATSLEGRALGLVLMDGERFPGQWLGVTVERLTIWGVEADAPAQAPRYQAALALAAGEPGAALALLPEELRVDRAMALARSGRPSAAITELAGAGDEALAGREPYLIRARREEAVPLLREALGERFLEIYQRAWSPSADRWQPWRHEALLEDLEGLDLFAMAPSLAATRAASLLESGGERGRREAAAWVARWEALPPAEAAPQCGALSWLERLLALEAAGRGEGDRAIEHARRSLGATDTPALTRDRLAVDPRWGVGGYGLAELEPMVLPACHGNTD